MNMGTWFGGKPAQQSTLNIQKESFLPVASPVGGDLFGVQVLGRNSGFAVGSGGVILKLTKYSWVEHSNSKSVTTNNLGAIEFNPDGDGIAIGYYDAGGGTYKETILHYDHATDSWSIQSEGNFTTKLYEVWYPKNDLAYAVGMVTNMLKWDGVSWSTVSTPTSEALFSVFYTDPDNLFAVGNNGVFIKSEDGGATWAYNKKLCDTFLYTIFVSGEKVWTAGENGRVFYSPDGGETFEEQDTPVTSNLNEVFMFSNSFGYIVGDYGVILVWDGYNWHQAESPSAGFLSSVWFYTRDYGYAVGSGGLIVKLQSGVFPNVIRNQDGEEIDPRKVSERASNKDTRTVSTPAISTDYFLPSSGSIDLSNYQSPTWFIYATTNPVTVQLQGSMDGGSTWYDLEGYNIASADFVNGTWNNMQCSLMLMETRLKVSTGDPAPGSIELAVIMKA